MKNNIKIVIIILFVIILIFGLVSFVGKNVLPDFLGNTSVSNGPTTSTTDEKLLDQRAPDFDLPDNAGNRVKLADVSYTPVMLVFWATWNVDSANQIKILDDYLLNKKIDDSVFKVVAIDSMEDPSIVKSFMKRGSYSVPIAVDTSGYISNYYNVKSLPTTFFIDKDGLIKEIYTGILSENMIVDKVENLLK